VITELIALDLTDVPAGSYRLALGVYDAGTGRRWPAATASGKTIPDGRVFLEETVTVP
jgi:hypothetical protein